MKPIKKEVESLNRYIKHEEDEDSDSSNSEHEDAPRRPKSRKVLLLDASHYGDIAYVHLMRGFSGADSGSYDFSFGIYYDNGRLKMGNKFVTIIDNDIIIDGEVYPGTPGLWNLITDPRPSTGEFTDDDVEVYINLVKDTNVLHRNFDPQNPYPRSSHSRKWNKLLKHIWNKTHPREITAGDGLQDPVKACKLHIQKEGKCYRVKTSKSGDLMSLEQSQRVPSVGDGLWLRHGQNVYDGRGLLLGPNSPFENIPILGWFL